MKKVLSLVLITLFISGCITPGIEEPDLWLCTIIDDKVMQCIHNTDSAKRDMLLIDGIGFQCVGPNSYAKIKTHHQILHEELNRKK